MAFSHDWTAGQSSSARAGVSSVDYNFNYYKYLAPLYQSCGFTSKSLMAASWTSNLNFSEERTVLRLAYQAVDLEFLVELGLGRHKSFSERDFVD